ncbi:uncharacterized protein LOC126899729 [Daktulosphaira vitifoliae]|uniref:uncharacterized protein LOC126899729 n=1 Tax=Daktulosphaira vitifoliae TaxID=58002 RepID=UPI0021AA458D|nr:uncharacterized protein LOC126899729 [Daktulosphaira vitifoliae]
MKFCENVNFQWSKNYNIEQLKINNSPLAIVYLSNVLIYKQLRDMSKNLKELKNETMIIRKKLQSNENTTENHTMQDDLNESTTSSNKTTANSQNNTTLISRIDTALISTPNIVSISQNDTGINSKLTNKQISDSKRMYTKSKQYKSLLFILETIAFINKNL